VSFQKKVSYDSLFNAHFCTTTDRLPCTTRNTNTSTHQHINTSTHQHINTSTHQHINTSTHQHINTSTHQHMYSRKKMTICNLKVGKKNDYIHNIVNFFFQFFSDIFLLESGYFTYCHFFFQLFGEYYHFFFQQNFPHIVILFFLTFPFTQVLGSKSHIVTFFSPIISVGEV